MSFYIGESQRSDGRHPAQFKASGGADVAEFSDLTTNAADIQERRQKNLLSAEKIGIKGNFSPAIQPRLAAQCLAGGVVFVADGI